MEYPTRDEIGSELLILILEKGGHCHEMKSCDTYGPLADRMELSAEARCKIRDEEYGDGASGLLWHNKVQWAREQLAADGYLYRNAPHGVWRLTEKGVNHARWWLECRERIRQKVTVALQDFSEKVEKRRGDVLS